MSLYIFKVLSDCSKQYKLGYEPGLFSSNSLKLYHFSFQDYLVCRIELCHLNATDFFIISLSPLISVYQSHSALCFTFTWQDSTTISVTFIFPHQHELNIILRLCKASHFFIVKVSTLDSSGSCSRHPLTLKLPQPQNQTKRLRQSSLKIYYIKYYITVPPCKLYVKI